MKKERLSEKTIRYIIRQRQKGTSASDIATEPEITARYVRMLWAKFKDTGIIPVLQKLEHPKKVLVKDTLKTILDQYDKMPAGVVRLTQRI